jgi:hypothetical protein
MVGRLLCVRLALILATAAVLQPTTLSADTVPVKHREGLIHGFLSLSSLDGEVLAYGDLIQVVKGDRLTLRLEFHFKDGSIHNETTILSERGIFRLLAYHLTQKGPAFKHPLDFSLDCSSGQATVDFTDDDGKEKTAREHFNLPPDIANGIVPTLLRNVSPDSQRTTLSFLAATPKPRLVKLAITPHGEDSFSFAGSSRRATHFVVTAEIGGITGLVAPLIGKRPPDTHVWILDGEAPAFVKSEGPLYFGGPVWRIELTSPVWPKASSENNP